MSNQKDTGKIWLGILFLLSGLILGLGVIFGSVAFGSLSAWLVLGWISIFPAISFAQVLAFGLAFAAFKLSQNLILLPFIRVWKKALPKKKTSGQVVINGTGNMVVA